jgi:hypothetical protein
MAGHPQTPAEVPETLTAACSLFGACGYVQEAILTDYVLPFDSLGFAALAQGAQTSQHAGSLVIPVTVDDLAANGLLEDAHSQTSWERSVATLTARKGDIAGLAVASDERIEAYVLYVAGAGPETEIVSLRSFIEDGGARPTHLLSRLRAQGMEIFRFPKVHPAEIPKEWLETLGFRAAGAHRLYATRARSA